MVNEIFLEDIHPPLDSTEAVCPLSKICFAGNTPPLPSLAMDAPARVHGVGLQQGFTKIRKEDVSRKNGEWQIGE